MDVELVGVDVPVKFVYEKLRILPFPGATLCVSMVTVATVTKRSVFSERPTPSLYKWSIVTFGLYCVV